MLVRVLELIMLFNSILLLFALLSLLSIKVLIIFFLFFKLLIFLNEKEFIKAVVTLSVILLFLLKKGILIGFSFLYKFFQSFLIISFV